MPTPRPTPPDRNALRRAFLASLSGTSLEWYDFSIYSAAAALVFPVLFFPGSDPVNGTLLAFSTYAVGYLSRPLGGVVFGRLGDLIGRKQVVVTTLLLIGVATFLIGVLPTYGSAGVLAPIMLVLLRFAQGIGVGGELGIAPLLASEFGDPRRRGFWCSAAQVAPPVGNLSANAVLAILTVSMSDEAFLSWGWRLAFLFSAVLVAVGLWIRLRLEDTPVFQAIRQRGERPEAPLREVFGHHRRALLAAVLGRIGPDVTYALFTVFVLSYGTLRAGFSRGEVLAAVLVGSACQLAVTPLAAIVSDRVRRRAVFAAGATAAAVWPFVFFPAIDTGSTAVLVAGVVVGLVLHSVMYGPQGAYITEQFSPRLRATGSTMGFAIGSVFGGALAPLAFTALLGAANSWVPVAVYVAIACGLTLVGLAIGRDHDLAEDERYQATGAAPAAAAATDRRDDGSR